jgi:hypothetical protein
MGREHFAEFDFLMPQPSELQWFSFNGSVAERLNAPVLKTGEGATLP